MYPKTEIGPKIYFIYPLHSIIWLRCFRQEISLLSYLKEFDSIIAPRNRTRFFGLISMISLNDSYLNVHNSNNWWHSSKRYLDPFPLKLAISQSNSSGNERTHTRSRYWVTSKWYIECRISNAWKRRQKTQDIARQRVNTPTSFPCTYKYLWHVQIKETFNYLKMFSCVLIKWSFVSTDALGRLPSMLHSKHNSNVFCVYARQIPFGIKSNF